MIRRLAPLLLLAACTQAVPHPVFARLGPSALNVVMSDNSTCSAALTGPAPWAGPLPLCDLSYSVTPTAGQSPIRLAFDAMIAAIRAGDLVAPMADIRLTDASGRVFSFASPVPLN